MPAVEWRSWLSILLAIGSAGVILIEAHSYLRFAVVTPFLLFITGWSVLRAMGLDDLGWPVAVATSLVAGVLISEAMIYLGGWAPDNALLVAAGVVVLIEAVGLFRSRHTEPTLESAP